MHFERALQASLTDIQPPALSPLPANNASPPAAEDSVLFLCIKCGLSEVVRIEHLNSVGIYPVFKR